MSHLGHSRRRGNVRFRRHRGRLPETLRVALREACRLGHFWLLGRQNLAATWPPIWRLARASSILVTTILAALILWHQRVSDPPDQLDGYTALVTFKLGPLLKFRTR